MENITKDGGRDTLVGDVEIVWIDRRVAHLRVDDRPGFILGDQLLWSPFSRESFCISDRMIQKYMLGLFQV